MQIRTNLHWEIGLLHLKVLVLTSEMLAFENSICIYIVRGKKEMSKLLNVRKHVC